MQDAFGSGRHVIVKIQLEGCCQVAGAPLCQELRDRKRRDDVRGAVVATCAPQQVINLAINNHQVNE